MLIIYLLILGGFIFSKGFFTFQSISVLIIAYTLFFISILKKQFLISFLSFSPTQILLLLIFLSAALYGGLFQHQSLIVWLSFILCGISIIFSILLLQKKHSHYLKFIYIGLFGCAILLRIFMVWSSPLPYIDVFDCLKNGAWALFNGDNPYSIFYTKLYPNIIPNFYPYLPGTLLATLPSVLLSNDPRYTFIASELITALLILSLKELKKHRYIFSLLFLYNPISLFLLEQSYTEPLNIALLTACAVLFFKNRLLASTLLFGLTLSSKQYLVFLIPLFYNLLISKLKIFRSPLFLIPLTVFVIVILPFFLWNQQDFIHDAILLQYNFPPRYEGLTFFSLLYKLGYPFNPSLSMLITLSIFIFIYLRRINKISNFFYLSSFLYFSFFFFNKWAFANYYYLIAQLFLLGIVFEQVEIATKDGEKK